MSRNPVAITAQGKKIAPHEARKGQQGLYCPNCHGEFIVKRRGRDKFFSHKPYEGTCDPDMKSLRSLDEQSVSPRTSRKRRRARPRKPESSSIGCTLLIAFLIILFAAFEAVVL